MNLSPLPIQKFFDNNGKPLVGGLLFTYEAGTSVKIDTYTDAGGGSLNTNPIVLDYRGECMVWLDITKTYKFILAKPGDTDPPTDPIWTVDNISVPIGLVDLTQQIIGRILYPQTAAEAAAGVTPTNYASKPGNVLRYATNAVPGTTDMTAAFTAARTVTDGRYHIPSGTYLVDASPDVWADCFTADGDTEIIIAGTTYDVSNAFAGRLRYRAASNVKMDIVDAPTGNIVMYMQNSEPGTATGFYRGLAFTTDSHFAQVQPATDGGSVDFLFQRSTLNVDPAGNRFSYTFEEAGDRWLFSYATTASGAPSFDTWMECGAGTSPYLRLPALQMQFNKGWSVKQRASGGFELEIVPGTTFSILRNKGTPANINMTFGDGSLGFYGASPVAKPTITGSRGGNAALASLLTALANLGLITDSSS